MIASAHATGRKAVLMIGSDGDLDARYTPDSDFVSQYGDVAAVCHRILQEADVIVAQTPRQQRLLRERFDRDSTVIANPFDLTEWDSRAANPLPAELRAGLDRYVLWVGRAERLHKRPQLLLDVARLCPAVDFLMILNPRDPVIERSIRADCPANVHMVSSVPFDLMPALFAWAAAFVSTSALEGFPNVFLQAAASGVPIGSLEVGEDFLSDAEAGICTAGNLDQLTDFVRSCWESPTPPSPQTRAYLVEHHNLRRQLARLREVLTTR